MSRANRPANRAGIAVSTAIAVALGLAGPLSGAAYADKDRPTGGNDAVPSQQSVDRAKRDVADKQAGVAELQAQLTAANARLQDAVTRAGYLAEQYNGAVWRLSLARKANRRAKAAAQDAVTNVEHQRKGIITLVTESYQNGTELNTATALVSDEGPEGLMNRYGVVQSAGDSMKASYDRFRVASTRAKRAAMRAEEATARQKQLAADARKLRDEAGQAAASAAYATNQIATQREQLVEALAKAQDISYGLAQQRQQGLERIAEEKAAAAERARQRAQELAQERHDRRAAALAKAAKKAQQKAKSAGNGAARPPDGGNVPPAPVVDLGPAIDYTPRAPGKGAQAAVNYAKQQLGKPYVWAAAGPNAFDCSGLTMRAWQAAGKSLPHFSGAQFTMGTRIPVEAARKGDLYFWTNNGRPSGIHHVAIALGGGRFIEAPRTGLTVRYNSTATWYPDYAVRP